MTAYVIDSGIRVTHQDFGGRARGGASFGNPGPSDTDCSGHGTHVAGTVGGSTHGVAKAVDLVAVRVFPCSGRTSVDNVIVGVDWVAGHHLANPGPAVANLSLGGGGYTPLDTAIRNAVATGVTVVVAAGNAGGNACSVSPARVAEALTVAASDDADRRASFSNSGRCVDLFAPGVGVTSAWIDGDRDTRTINGTSMASPHVAGVAARYLGTHPDADPAEVAAAITERSSPDRVQDAGAGTPNRLLNTGFLLAGPGITSVLDAAPESPRDFGFERCAATGACTPFALDDDADPTLANWHGAGGLAPGVYTVSFAGAPGWDLEALECDGDSVVDLVARRATVTVDGLDQVTCTFRPASSALTVVSDAEPAVGQDFTYTVCPRPGPGRCRTLVLDEDDESTRAERRTVTGLASGRYRVVATGVSGWDHTMIRCDDGSAPITGSTAHRGRVVVDIARGQHVTCTFSVGTTGLTVVHQAEGAVDDVAYRRCRVATGRCRDLVLDDDADDAARPAARTFIVLRPGEHSITPGLPSGWTRRDLDCSEAVDVAGARVTVDLAPGEHVTCTFRLAPGGPPAHDAFAAAHTISGRIGSATASNVRATAEPGEPAHAGHPAAHSLWYRWTAPTTTSVRFYTCGSPGSDFDTVLAVYTGSSLATLREEASNDDEWRFCGDRAWVELSVTAGTTYHIAVDGHPGAVGTAVLRWNAD